MEIDLKQMMNKLNTKVNGFIQKTQAYFKSLSQYELYAWIAIGVGFILVLIAIIAW